MDYLPFMEPVVLLASLLQSVTRPYPKPVEFSLPPRTLFP